MRIRLAEADDLPSINSIYNYYVEHSTCTYEDEPTSEVNRAEWLASRAPIHPVTVAIENDQVVGWAALSPFHSRSGYRHTVENALYVRSDRQRRGVGKALLIDLIERARELQHHTIIARIDAEQPASIEIHKAVGFIEVGRLREAGWKFDRWLDAIFLQLILPRRP